MFDLDAIEDPLIAAIEVSGIGEFDGNLIGPDGAILYMYAADADTLFEVIGPVLAGIDLPAGSSAVKRYGTPGAHETRVNLTWQRIRAQVTSTAAGGVSAGQADVARAAANGHVTARGTCRSISHEITEGCLGCCSCSGRSGPRTV